MTELLKRLLHAYGMLYITITQLEESRPGTCHDSLKEYYDSLGSAEPGEPTLIVRVSKDGETRILRDFTGPEVPDHLRSGDVTLMELPEDEFYFFRAFRSGAFDLQREVPAFIFEMSLVYSYALFETYISDIIRLRLKSHPAQLGMAKQVTVAQVLASADKDALLDFMIDRELNQIMYEPIGAVLTRLRDGLGLRSLQPDFDQEIVKLSLVRNCLMHNGGNSDEKVAALDPMAPLGKKIVVSGDHVRSAIETCRRAAAAIDSAS